MQAIPTPSATIPTQLIGNSQPNPHQTKLNPIQCTPNPLQPNHINPPTLIQPTHLTPNPTHIQLKSLKRDKFAKLACLLAKIR